MNMNIFDEISKKAWSWLEEISNCSITDNPNTEGVTRFSLTPQHKQANQKLCSWMQESGMSVRTDNAGNLIGHYASFSNKAKTLIIGSHQDTVPNGGKYDGILGVILPIALVNYYNKEQLKFDYNIDIIVFSDEEGSRFQSTLLGSKAIAGTFTPDLLKSIDKDNVSLYQALKDFKCNPEKISQDKYQSDQLLGFLELHIEQGPQLESLNIPVGIVNAITGIERHQVSIIGKAGHAGTVPMHLRKDSLVATSEIISFINNICLKQNDMVGVVGQINNFPNGINVIPQKTNFSIELRSPKDTIRQNIRNEILTFIDKIAEKYKVQIHIKKTYEQSAVLCSTKLSNLLKDAIIDTGLEAYTLFSGAGHDGLAISTLTDIAMLFIRCKDGISHHPDESVNISDLSASIEVLNNFLKLLSSNNK